MLWYIQALSRGNRIVSTDAMPQRYQGSSKSSQCVSDNYFYGSANQEIVDASVHENEKKRRGCDRRPLPSQYPVTL